MAEKMTILVIKVDLQCPSCYKRIKKVLCKYPQIRDQVYDEKGNTVTVSVFYYDPEKLRDKLYSRGGKVIKGIEIKEPAKLKEPEKKKETEKPNPKEPEKPKVVVVEKPKQQPEKPKADGGKPDDKTEKPKSDGGKPDDKPEKPKSDGGKPENKPKEAPKPKGPEPGPNPPPPEPVKLQAPVSGYPHPAMAYYGPNYDGYGGGTPYYHGYGVPPPPQPSYDGYYGYQYGRGSNFNRADSYFSEENPSSCSIM